MCGLSAIINKSSRPVERTLIESMNDKIIHRGPDDSGVFLKENIGFGFRRLSILDLSSHGHQPMIDDLGNTIIFNGEIFNYLEIKSTLKSKGIVFSTGSDTEVILAAYRRWGLECFSKFNGMWGIVIYDPQKNKIIASRDRFGIKPLYYWEHGEQMVFCSEVKQLLANPSFTPKLETDSAARFLIKRQLNTSTNTFFKDVIEFTPGHIMTLDLNSFRKDIFPYYDITTISPNLTISYEEAQEEFYRLFQKAVNIRLRSDVPIGSCLSGGLDSSSIVAIAKNQSSDNLSATTISSCWSDSKYDEQEYIDEIIATIKFNSIKIFPKINDLRSKDLFSEIVYHQDQPIKSASHFSEYSVFKAAREYNLTVMLDGQGSDEFLAGYIPFRFYNVELLKKMRVLKLFREVLAQKKNHYGLFDLVFHNLSHFMRSSGINLPTRNAHGKRFFSSELNNLLSQRPQDKINFSSYKENSLNEIKYSSIPYQLHSEDRNSMMHSIESRLPFLDFDLADFMFSLPDEYKMSSGTTKRILRDSLRPFLPSKIVNRHSKKGFEAPEEPFIRDNNGWVRDIIKRSIDQYPNLIEPKVLNHFDRMISKSEKYDNTYFRIISFQLWSERFNVKT